MSKRHDCTNPAGHNFSANGHVRKCNNSQCGKVQTFNPKTKKWMDTK